MSPVVLKLLPILLAMWSSVGVTAEVTTAGLEGAWELRSYNLDGEDVEVTGILIFTGGKFGMIYAMDGQAGSKFGRAHAGEYQVDSDVLTFDVQKWIQKVADGTGVIPPTVIDADIDIQDNELVIRFEGGSVQKFKRLDSRGISMPSGYWRLDHIRDEDAGQSDTGMFVGAAGRYVLIHLDESKRGRALGGFRQEDNRVLATKWALSVDGNNGTMSYGSQLPVMEYKQQRDVLEITDSDMRSLIFKDQ